MSSEPGHISQDLKIWEILERNLQGAPNVGDESHISETAHLSPLKVKIMPFFSSQKYEGQWFGLDESDL